MALRSHFPSGLCVISVWASIACSELTGNHQPALASVAIAVHPAFSLEAPNAGPFPSDWFTIADPDQLTGLRVNLPVLECGTAPSPDCLDVEQINMLDGFNPRPRLSIPFDGPIDVYSVTSENIFLSKIDSDRDAQVIGINQVVWDPETLTLHVESDEILDQNTRYALIVTRRIRDSSGNPIEATEAFRRFRQTVPHPYKQALLAAIHAARRIGIREDEIAVSSVFTTLSATAVMEKIRDQIMATRPAPAEILLANGLRTVFPLAEIAPPSGSVIRRRHTGISPDTFSDQSITGLFNFLNLAIPGAITQVAYGKYISPQFRVDPGLYIPAIATRTGVPQVQEMEELYFTLFIPSGQMPPTGWPVVIEGVGGSGSKDTTVVRAPILASQGFASIMINPPGHGNGPLGTLIITRNGLPSITFPAGGRGRDVNGDRIIGAFEGYPSAAQRLANRDGNRQAAIDLMQLVRVIKQGIDVDGDGVADLDPNRVYYAGYSNAGIYGTVFMAIEPELITATIGTAGTTVDIGRISPVQRNMGELLEGRHELINRPGITALDGVTLSLPGPFVNENYPLRDGVPYKVRLQDGTMQVIQSPTINQVSGAIAIQEVLERFKWIQAAGAPVVYAPHLRKAPLPGMPAKLLLIHICKGDRNVPNPTNTAIVRAGDLADRTTYYRHDLAFAEDPSIDPNPHGALVVSTIGNPLVDAIGRGAQRQVANFFVTDGAQIVQAEPARFFETPISSPLPEGLNFIVPNP